MGFDFCTSHCLSLLNQDLSGSARPLPAQPHDSSHPATLNVPQPPQHGSAALSPRAATPKPEHRARDAGLGVKRLKINIWKA